MVGHVLFPGLSEMVNFGWGQVSYMLLPYITMKG